MCPDTDWLVSEDRAGGRGKMRNHQRTNQKSVSQRVLRNHRRSNKATKQRSNEATKQRSNDDATTQRRHSALDNAAATQRSLNHSLSVPPTHLFHSSLYTHFSQTIPIYPHTRAYSISHFTQPPRTQIVAHMRLQLMQGRCSVTNVSAVALPVRRS